MTLKSVYSEFVLWSFAVFGGVGDVCVKAEKLDIKRQRERQRERERVCSAKTTGR